MTTVNENADTKGEVTLRRTSDLERIVRLELGLDFLDNRLTALEKSIDQRFEKIEEMVEDISNNQQKAIKHVETIKYTLIGGLITYASIQTGFASQIPIILTFLGL